MQEYINVVNNVNFENYFTFKLEICGYATCIRITERQSIVGTQSSIIFIFLIEDDYQQGYKALGKLQKNNMVKDMDISADEQYLVANYENKDLIVYSLGSYQELLRLKNELQIQQFQIVGSEQWLNWIQVDEEQNVKRYLVFEKDYVIKNILDGNKMQNSIMQIQTKVQQGQILVGVLYVDKLLVIAMNYDIRKEQQRILLEFSRPEAVIYRLIFNEKENVEQIGYLTWGSGQFKQTNKNNDILIVNWGYNEYYAFKVMDDLSIVQGGHIYLKNNNNQKHYITQFISNNIFISYQNNQLMFLNTSQFEYGLPFTLKQIEQNYKQECRIAKLSNQQYSPVFHKYGDILISQPLLDSINQGYQQYQYLKIKQQSECKQYVYIRNNYIYILQGLSLLEINIKHWQQYLDQLKYVSYPLCFEQTIKILNNSITMLHGIQSNSQCRQTEMNAYIQQLAKEYLSQQNNDPKEIIYFLIESNNEEYLFDSCLQYVASDIFYNEISKVILKNSKLNITDNHLIETFKKIERISIQKYIYSMQNINYDISPLIKYLIDQNMVSELIHVTSLNYDFITPYQHITTLLQRDSQYEQYLFPFLSNCLNHNKYSLNKYQKMLNDLFTTVLQSSNLLMFLSLDYQQALAIFLLIFEEKIQQILTQKSSINLELNKITKDTFLDDYIDIHKTPQHLIQLSNIYILIKQAELTYLQTHPQHEDISVAFTAHVLAQCPLKLKHNHLLLNISRYITILRNQQDTIFDINWVMIGKVTKDQDVEIIKNEFLLRLVSQIDFCESLFQQLLIKAKQQSWIWLQCYLLNQLGQTQESLNTYLNSNNKEISQKIFNDLSNMFRSQDQPCFQFLLSNIDQLYQINSKKLFSIIYTYCKDYWILILNLEIDKKIILDLIQFIRDRDINLDETIESIFQSKSQS